MARPITRANANQGTGQAASVERRGQVAPRAFGGTLRPDREFELELDVRTAYDFVLSLRTPEAIRDEELLPDDRQWLEAAQSSAGAIMTDPVLTGSTHFMCELSSLLVDHPEVRTAADVVALFDGLDDDRIVDGLLSELKADPAVGQLLTRVLDGDASALPEFEARWAEIKPDHPLGELLEHRTEYARHIRDGLRGWLRPYQRIEARVARMIQRDADQRRVDLGSMAPAEVIERSTGGLRWLPEAHVRRVVLAPTYFGRPYNYLYASDAWRLIVYPITDDALDAADRLAPPPAAVRLYRALGDETRLRILRLLVDRDLYLTELAQLLELSKPTVKHHLTQLRTAGLVTITEEGGLTYYSLRRNRVQEAGPELARFLRG